MPAKGERPGVGLVGLGRFGRFQLAAYATMPEVRVVAVCDTFVPPAGLPPAIKFYTEWDRFLADPEVDIVVVSTPPDLHAPLAQQAIQAGKHVLVEKPLALNLADAEKTVHMAQQNGVCLTVDYVLRHHPLYRLVFQLARRRLLGDLHLFCLTNLVTDEGLPPDHWFWDPARSGGIHVEHGVHFFDLCNQLAEGEPDSVQGYALRRPSGQLDRVAAVVRYGHRVLGLFYHSFNRPRRIECTTVQLGFQHGEVWIHGWIPERVVLAGLVQPEELDFLQQLFSGNLQVVERVPEGVRVRAEATTPDRRGEYQRAIQAVMRDLVHAVQTGAPMEVQPAHALSSLKVALQATPS